MNSNYPSSSSSSTTTTTAPATLPRRGQSDVFRPRLPLDPFSPISQPGPAVQRVHVDPDAPWPAHDLLALEHTFSQSPHVLLVLGAPSPHALAPLLRSTTFSRSLILLVTHAPPPLSALLAAAGPNTAHAAIRVLRLRAPLAPAAPAFALTLVSILDAAASVARAWRAAPDPEPASIAQLAQAAEGDAAFSIPEPLADGPVHAPLPVNEHLHPPGRRSLLAPVPVPAASNPYPANRARPPSALSLPSTTHLLPSSPSSASSSASPNKRTSRRDSASSAKSFASTASSKSTAKPTPGSRNDGTRAFDALLSFLPPAQPEKAVLKQVVLVSTLAGGFLAGPAYASVHHAASSYSSYSYFGADDKNFEWSSAPNSPYPQTASAETSRPGTPGSMRSRRGSVRSFKLSSLFGSSNDADALNYSKSQPASPRASVYNLGARGGGGAGASARAHIVHVLPASYRSPKLVGALSSFLASYSPSLSGDSSAGAGAGGGAHAKAYVLAERALGEVGCLLVGALEAVPAVSMAGVGAGGPDDFRLTAAPQTASPSSPSSTPSSTPRTPQTNGNASPQNGTLQPHYARKQMGRSSPDLRELPGGGGPAPLVDGKHGAGAGGGGAGGGGGRRKRWWAFWG
ncbi:hypothetical protein DFH06DRAFT_265705 [Mycena polygramma]|nr:hypothetical protein DFH06DRAFT_265705 [Mycena polygramma]